MFVLIGVLMSIMLVAIGISATSWFWHIPRARTLSERAHECQGLPVRTNSVCSSTKEFIERHTCLFNRIKIIDRHYMAEIQLEQIQEHFVIFVLALLLGMVILIVKSSEHASNQTNFTEHLTQNLDTFWTAIERLGDNVASMWAAPYIESGFFFMAMYSLFFLLTDFKELNKSSIN